MTHYNYSTQSSIHESIKKHSVASFGLVWNAIFEAEFLLLDSKDCYEVWQYAETFGAAKTLSVPTIHGVTSTITRDRLGIGIVIITSFIIR